VAITRAKHHSSNLDDDKKPSVFIKEVASNKDRTYQFNQISTEGVKSAPPEYGTCPFCGAGKVAMRVLADRRFFFGCRHYPYCDYTPKTCNLCNRCPMIKTGLEFRCQNPDCGNIAKACRRCDGMMVARSGRYGRFLGCSNYGQTGCGYTEKT
jgi:DNA helicase-4